MTIDVDAVIAALQGRPARTTGKPCRTNVDHAGRRLPVARDGSQEVIRR